jgi:hypothetical protein
MAALLVGFAAGMLTQRAGVPGKLKQVVFKTAARNRDAPILTVPEVPSQEPPLVRLREFPYPFKCALAIASDIDYCSLEDFEEIHRFLNTTQMTSMGPGLGLDIGDSMWMYDLADLDPTEGFPPSMSYWKGVTPGQAKHSEQIQDYVRKGWIDSLHTYGNFSRKEGQFTRQLAKAALDELSAKHLRLDTWLDHGDECNSQDFVEYSKKTWQNGDNPRSPAYHTDLLLNYGVRYAHGKKRQTFGTKRLVEPLTLRDGRSIWQFSRYVHEDWYPNALSRQLAQDHLKTLVNENLWEIVANHFGGPTPQQTGRLKTRPPFGREARSALLTLAFEFRRGNIMVLRASRLLKYHIASLYLDWDYDPTANRININAVNDPVLGRYVPQLSDLRGITFYLPSPESVVIVLNGAQIPSEFVMANGHDGTSLSATIWPYFNHQ